MDGLLIYQPFHILGFFSAFPEDLVSSVDFYAGGFGARYSGRTSSVLDVRMRDGNRNAYAGTGSVSPFVAEMVAEGPMSQGQMSFLVSARQAVLEETSGTLLGKTQPLSFESQFAKMSFFGAGDARCSAMVMHTNDRGRLDVEDDVSRVAWENLAFGGRCVDALEGTHRLVDFTFGFSRVRNTAVTRNARSSSRIPDAISCSSARPISSAASVTNSGPSSTSTSGDTTSRSCSPDRSRSGLNTCG
jgi:hypothetical protein